MRTKFQEGKFECGVACIRMLTGVDYNKAKEKLDEIMKGELEKRGSTSAELCEALEACGRKPVKGRVSPIGDRDYRKFTFDAILKKEGDSPQNWHWMVWDAKYQKVRDPEGLQRHHNVIGYIAVADAARPKA